MKLSIQNKNIIVRIIILIVVMIAGIIYLLGDYQFDCIFHKITGLYCPGCGITRCLNAIIHMKFYQAFRFNPYLFLLMPLIFPYVSYQIYIWIFSLKDKLTTKIPKGILITLLITLILYGILRNISYFNWLAPTNVY